MRKSFISSFIYFLTVLFFIALSGINIHAYANGCPTDKPMKDIKGNCFSCDYPNKIEIDANYFMDCQRLCGHKRVMSKDWKYCLLDNPNRQKLRNPCPDGQFPDIVTNKCHPCDIDDEILTTDTNCQLCGNKRKMSGLMSCILADKKCDKNEFLGSDGKCYSCDTPEGIYMGQVTKNCSMCGNKRRLQADTCILASKKCAIGEIMDEDGNCFSCDEPNVIHLGKIIRDCEKYCPGKRIGTGSICILKNCPTDKPLRSEGYDCYSCDTTEQVEVNDVEKNCDICPNRFVHTFKGMERKGNRFCVLKTCPVDKPLQDWDKRCYPCDTKENIYMGSDATECPTACQDKRFFWFGDCRLNCPENHFVDAGGKCRSCDDKATYHIDRFKEKAQAACGDKRAFVGDEFIKLCEKNEFMDKTGNCHSCDTDKRINVTDIPENCNKCPNRVISEFKELSALYCVKKCPEGQFMNIIGECELCDNHDFIRVRNENDCTVCPNRHIRYENKCAINKCPDGYDEIADDGQNLEYERSQCVPNNIWQKKRNQSIK